MCCKDKKNKDKKCSCNNCKCNSDWILFIVKDAKINDKAAMISDKIKRYKELGYIG